MLQLADFLLFLLQLASAFTIALGLALLLFSKANPR